MSRDGKKNMGQSVFQRLLNRARERGEDFNFVLSRYAMERFIYRLSISPFVSQFILKGAALLFVWKGQNYRVTRDIDLLATDSLNPESAEHVFKEICRVECPHNDGMGYSPDSVRAEVIREDNIHDGIRIKLAGNLNTARIPIQIDVGFGDNVTPEPEIVEYPSLLDVPCPRIKAYPRYTMVAEKLNAMVSLGYANSRMKDFFDIWLLSHLFHFDANTLTKAITGTFSCRDTDFPDGIPFAFTPEFYADAQKKRQWKAFLGNAKPGVKTGELSEVITRISGFIMPVLEALDAGSAKDATWSPETGWEENT